MIFLLVASALPYLGDHTKGEIEIVLDPVQVSEIEETQTKRLIKKGFTETEAKEWSQTGVIAKDLYWIWRRDAVLFPSGVGGTYDRLSWNEITGVAILPILPNNRIALNLNFRHATRSWEWELPRGGVKTGESDEEAALRELAEETGLRGGRVEYLGSIAVDSGVLDSVVPIYIGWVSEEGESDVEFSEAIASIHTFSREELDEGLARGYIEIEPQGKVPLRDPFLTYALYRTQKIDEK